MDAEGGKPRRLTDETSEDFTPTWSRDGRWIYFSSKRSGSLQLWKMRSEGGEPVQLTRHGGFRGVESLDGKVVYYVQDKPGIYQVPVEGGDETVIIAGYNAGWPWWQNWAVADDGIYFIKQDSNGVAAIEFFNFATRQVRNVAPIGKINLHPLALAFSPDRRWFLYTQVDPGNTGNITMVENFR